MFRIAFMVEDKNLSKVLRDVAGSVKDLDVRPVVNTLPSPGKGGKTKAASGGDVQSMLMQKLHDTMKAQGAETFKIKEVEKGLQELGRPSNPANAHATLQRLMKNSIVIRVAKGVYMLNSNRED